jgi:anti-sigma B factor antagonist
MDLCIRAQFRGAGYAADNSGAAGQEGNPTVSDDRKLAVDVDESRPGVVVVHLAGELDVGTTGSFRQMVTPHAGTGREVLLDISRLEFCDSTGMGAMVSMYRAATGAGARLHVCGPQPQMQKTLNVIGLDQVFVMHPDLSSALASITPRSGQAG